MEINIAKWELENELLVKETVKHKGRDCSWLPDTPSL